MDIEVGDKSDGHQHVTEFFWLCAQCARKMNPRIDVAGKVVTLRLSMNQPGKQDGPLTRVN